MQAIAIEGDHTRPLEAEVSAKRKALAKANPDRAEEARRQRDMQCPAAAASQSQPALVVKSHRIQIAADRRHANRPWLGTGQYQGSKSFRIKGQHVAGRVTTQQHRVNDT